MVISQEQRVTIAVLAEEGYTSRQIAQRLGVSKSTVNYTLQRFHETRSFQDRPRSGRPSTLSQIQHLYLRQLFHVHNFKTASEIADLFYARFHINLDIKYIHRMRRKAGYRPYRARTRHPLSERNKADRLHYAQSHRTRQWTHDVFLDEKIFQIGPNREFVFVRRMDPVQSRWQYNRSHPFQVNVVAAISKQGKCGISIFCQKFNSVVFKSKFNNYLLPFIERNYPHNYTLVLDNSRVHRSNYVRNWFEEEGIHAGFLPPYSPDMNPIEKVWAYMGHEVSKRRPTTKPGLMRAIKDVWDKVSDTMINSLIDRLPDIMEEAIERNGEYTRC